MPSDNPFDPRNPIDWVALAFLISLGALAILVMYKAFL